jgi:hypothetical protein
MAKRHYIDNNQFLQEMIAYTDKVNNAKSNGAPKPRIPEYVGECFMKIAENLSHKPNFISYTFRDEMISDAIENCVLYANNFNPAKSNNPFAYFTQIVYYAFLRRIQREKKQLYVKYKSAELSGVIDEHDQLDGDGVNRQFELYDNISQFIENYENSRAAKAEKKMKNIDGLLEGIE